MIRFAGQKYTEIPQKASYRGRRDIRHQAATGRSRLQSGETAARGTTGPGVQRPRKKTGLGWQRVSGEVVQQRLPVATGENGRKRNRKRDAYAKHNGRPCGKPRRKAVGVGRERVGWREKRINGAKKYFCGIVGSEHRSGQSQRLGNQPNRSIWKIPPCTIGQKKRSRDISS